MLVIPRLDVVDGSCYGNMSNPIATARALADAGFARIHITDRDAVEGRGSNARIVEDVVRDAAAEIQVASGSESLDDIDALVGAGASRIVVGPRALAESDWLVEAADAFPGALIVETNVYDRRVVTRGWVRTLPVDLLELVDDIAAVPLAALLLVTRDGASAGGFDLSLLEDVSESCAAPVLVEDRSPTIQTLYAYEQRGVAGVLVPESALATDLDMRSVANEFGR